MRRARGAALLTLMLALVVGAGWTLLSGLNEHARSYARRAVSKEALNQARRALLHYAMNYADLRDNQEKGPGFLPCPDRNNDGRPETNCSAGAGTTLGRLPFTILGLDDPRDAAGERLWYALSANFKNAQSNDAIINSETPGELSLDGVGDMVAVIIAPGAPVGAQHARPGNDPAAYLEGGNADAGAGKFSTTAGNDQVAAVSRAELMAVVERRALHEVRALLARHYAAHGVYPPLTPFADPRAAGRIVRGRHSGGDNAAQLTDKGADFGDWGIAVHDVVRNITDGSVAQVTAVTPKTLRLSAPSAGLENDFDRGDVYFIERRDPARALAGTAGAGSRGRVLKDVSRDFRKLGVTAGDVVENLDDGSRGSVAAVTRTSLTVAALHGGVENDFDVGESWRLRGNTGTAGAGSRGLILADPHGDFIARGVLPGDLVENLADGSSGHVGVVAGPAALTVAGLDFGRNNAFRPGDGYRLPRTNGRAGARKGMLAIHTPGAVFPTGFTATWRLRSGGVVTGSVPGLRPALAAAVRQSPVGGVGIAAAQGRCAWLNARTADCAGRSAVAPYLEGTAAPGSTSVLLLDPAQDFTRAGIARGDLIYEPYVAVVTGLAGAAALTMQGLAPLLPDPAAAGRYRIKAALRRLDGRTDAASGDRLHDSTRDFARAGVRVGDLVENTTDGSFGLVTAVSGSRLSAALHGGATNRYRAGDDYAVYHGYVNRRRYRLNLRYQGNEVVGVAAGRRQRSVCLGYGAACASAPAAVPLPHYDVGGGTAGGAGSAVVLEDAAGDFLRRGVLPGDTVFNLADGSAGMVTTVASRSLGVAALDGGANNDFQPGDAYRVGRPLALLELLDDDVPAARLALTVPPRGARGAVRADAIDYYPAETSGDLPHWFVKNRWRQLLYVAYAAGFAPGGRGACAAGIDCLGVRGPAVVMDDRPALAAAAGMALPGQRRSSGLLADYYEEDNATLYADDLFTAGERTDTFNDQLVVVSP